MDKFDLRKYLAEGKLIKESEMYDREITKAQFDALRGSASKFKKSGAGTFQNGTPENGVEISKIGSKYKFQGTGKLADEFIKSYNLDESLNESKVLTGEEVAKALRKLDQKYDGVVSKDFIIKVKRLKKVTKKTLEKMGAKGKILDDIFGLLKEDREAEEMAAGMPPKPGSKRDKDAEMRSETFSITSEYGGKMERLSYDQIEGTLESALEIANNVEDFVEKVTYGLTDETSVLSLEDQDKLEIWYNSRVPKTQDFDGEVGDDLRSDLSDIDKLKDEYELLYSEKYPSGARRAGFKHRSTLGNDRYGDLYFHSDWPREFRHEDEYDSMSDDKQDILSQVEEFEFEVSNLFRKYKIEQNSHAG